MTPLGSNGQCLPAQLPGAPTQPPASPGQALLTCEVLHHLLFLESSLTVTCTGRLRAGGIREREGRASEGMAHSQLSTEDTLPAASLHSRDRRQRSAPPAIPHAIRWTSPHPCWVYPV